MSALNDGVHADAESHMKKPIYHVTRRNAGEHPQSFFAETAMDAAVQWTKRNYKGDPCVVAVPSRDGPGTVTRDRCFQAGSVYRGMVDEGDLIYVWRIA